MTAAELHVSQTGAIIKILDFTLFLFLSRVSSIFHGYFLFKLAALVFVLCS